VDIEKKSARNGDFASVMKKGKVWKRNDENNEEKKMSLDCRDWFLRLVCKETNYPINFLMIPRCDFHSALKRGTF
jgi:hypothetical protein